jgi:RNA polymerase sigma-70 factor (ECF subfamily)
MGENVIDDRTIEACRYGDTEAFRLIYESYKDRVYSIAFCFFEGDEATARDITQQVFLKLMTMISKFESRSQFSTWLYRVVTNACLDRKRSLRRLLFFGSSHEIPIRDKHRSLEDAFANREIEASVRKAVAALKPKLRIAILLKYFEDLSYDEMAVALGCSKGTVASRLNRAHQVLARKLVHFRGALVPGE